jgi:hypothetical protein
MTSRTSYARALEEPLRVITEGIFKRPFPRGRPS